MIGPALLIVVPVEGRAHAILVCESFEDQERLALDVAERELLREVRQALLELADALDKELAA
jgi:hypothetical protein